MQPHRAIMFPHPFDEHPTEENANIKEWNTSRHHRKFMLVDGAYLASLQNNTQVNSIQTGKIMFWGEWESESTFTRIGNHDRERRNDALPMNIHEPKCFVNDIFTEIAEKHAISEISCSAFFKNKQNTDPYVFGNQFMYSCCKQNGRNPLKDLQKGDLIIFYGQKGKKNSGNYRCYIDTVFVVGGIVGKGKYEDMMPSLLRDPRISDQFLYKVILPIVYGNKGSLGKNAEEKGYVLYYGATYDNPAGGMFSYFPCMIDKKDGFQRFECEPFDRHKVGEKSTGRKCYPDNNVSANTYETQEEVADLWKKLTDSILHAGYCLGIKATEPTLEKRI